MTQTLSEERHSIESVRTLRQNVNVGGEPFGVVNADDVVVFAGWIFDGAALRVPRVFARVRDADIPGTTTRREDVAKALGPEALHAGFAVAVAIAAFRDRLLDVELVWEDVRGGRHPFGQRRIVVAGEGPIERSDAIVVDRCIDLDRQAPMGAENDLSPGAVLGVGGSGSAVASDGKPYAAAAVTIAGRVYQAEYGIGRERAAGSTENGVEFFAQVPSLRFGAGSFDIRARLYAGDGTAIESARAVRVRFAGVVPQ